MVAPEANDLFICEDAHQPIYGERLILSRFGIETRGRSRRLTLNYRSSWQNLTFAVGVIKGAEVIDSDGETESVAGYRAAFNGPPPMTRGFSAPAQEDDLLVATVRTWLEQDTSASTIGVLVRRSSDQERARQALQAAGVKVQLLGKEASANPERRLTTCSTWAPSGPSAMRSPRPSVCGSARCCWRGVRSSSERATAQRLPNGLDGSQRKVSQGMPTAKRPYSLVEACLWWSTTTVERDCLKSGRPPVHGPPPELQILARQSHPTLDMAQGRQ